MIAQEFSKVLWDVEPSRLEDVPDSFVIRRVLAYGGIKLIFKLIRMNGIETVREEFNVMKATSMDRRRHHYLKEYVLL